MSQICCIVYRRCSIPSALSTVCHFYHLSCLHFVLSIFCPVYSLSCWLSCLPSVLSITCPIYHLCSLSSVLSTICTVNCLYSMGCRYLTFITNWLLFNRIRLGKLGHHLLRNSTNFCILISLKCNWNGRFQFWSLILFHRKSAKSTINTEYNLYCTPSGCEVNPQYSPPSVQSTFFTVYLLYRLMFVLSTIIYHL